MEKIKLNYKKSFFPVVTFIFLILISTPVLSVSARILDSSLTTQNVYFTGDNYDHKTWYQDAIDGNPDLGLELCDVGQKYVGATYAINVGGTWKYSLITYRSSTKALAYTSLTSSAGCYYTVLGELTFSPSYLPSAPTPSPSVYIAAFPGKVFVTYADSENPGTLTNFVLADGRLLGDYTVSRSFDEGTKRITVETPTIQFQTISGYVTKSATDPDFGVNSERRMVVGVCGNVNGESCYSGVIVPTEATFPLSLDAGTPTVSDQVKYDRYVVINGLGKYICIGANLKPGIAATNPSGSPPIIYYSQYLTVNYTISNPRDVPTEQKGGNVGVTTDFKIRIKIYRQDNASYVVFDQEYLVTNDIPPDGTVTGSFTWQANVKSGYYIFELTVDSGNNINECDETDNTVSFVFRVKPIIIPKIYINGELTNTFPKPGVPYNVTMIIKNSDNVTIGNATVELVEKNGIASFVPTQIFNVSVNSTDKVKNGTFVETHAFFPTDYNGKVELTIIPSGNPLYAPEYSYLGVKDVIGNYSIYMKGVTFCGEEFVYIINGTLTREYPLYVQDYYRYSDFDSWPKNLPNLENYAKALMNTVYTIFARFWKVLVS